MELPSFQRWTKKKMASNCVSTWNHIFIFFAGTWLLEFLFKNLTVYWHFVLFQWPFFPICKNLFSWREVCWEEAEPQAQEGGGEPGSRSSHPTLPKRPGLRQKQGHSPPQLAFVQTAGWARILSVCSPNTSNLCCDRYQVANVIKSLFFVASIHLHLIYIPEKGRPIERTYLCKYRRFSLKELFY